MTRFIAYFITILAVCFFVIYFLNHGQLSAVNSQKRTISPTPIAQVSLFPSVTLTPTASLYDSQADDSEIIRQMLADKYNKPLSDVTFTGIDYDGSHLRCSFSFKLAMLSGYLLAAKDEDQKWQLIFDGKGIPKCKLTKPYNFPATMVPECL